MQHYATNNSKNNPARRNLPVYRRPWFFMLIIFGIIALVFCIWFFLIRSSSTTNNNESSTNQTNSTIDTIPSSTAAKGANSSQEGSANANNTEEPNPQTPAQYEGENPNQKEEITGHISYTAINEDALSIRLTLNQYLTSGTCNLKMSLGSQVIEQSAPIFADPSTSSCQGFDVPLSELSTSGTWQITVQVSANGKTGIITGDYNL